MRRLQIKLYHNKSNQMLVFGERAKPGYPGEKLSEQNREPTNSVRIGRTGYWTRPHWWKASALTTAPKMPFENLRGFLAPDQKNFMSQRILKTESTVYRSCPPMALSPRLDWAELISRRIDDQLAELNGRWLRMRHWCLKISKWRIKWLRQII